MQYVALIFRQYALIEEFCGVWYEEGENLVLEFYVVNLVLGWFFDKKKGEIAYLLKLLACAIFKFS